MTLEELKAQVDSLHVGDAHWVDDIVAYKALIARVEKVVGELRQAEKDHDTEWGCFCGEWADELEGK